MRLKPLEDRVIVRKQEAAVTSAGGIILPESATKEQPNQGLILTVGPGKIDDKGNYQPIGVNQGETILFAKYSGTEVKVNGIDYLILAKRDILAVLEPPEEESNATDSSLPTEHVGENI